MMLRALLAVYFSVTTLLAPLLCCCLVRPDESQRIEQAEPACCCCRPKPADDQPLPPEPRHDCPCREQYQAQALVGDTLRLSKPEFAGVVDALPPQFVTNGSVIEMRAAIPPGPAELFAESVRARLSLLCHLTC